MTNGKPPELVRGLGAWSSAAIVVECQGDSQRAIGCSTRIPFQRFSIQIQFHESLLHQWMDVVDFSLTFLASKQVKQ